MTNTEEQRKLFWELFDEILLENGEPFKISYQNKKNEIKHNGAVNKDFTNTPSGTAIDLGFNLRKGVFRVNFYIPDLNIDLKNKLLVNKEQINSMITLPLLWEKGEKNELVLRPSVYFNFIQNDVDDYRRVIEESLPTIIEFINVANMYGKDEFFDF